MKKLFTPEEMMIITLDYYIERLKNEKEIEKNNLKKAKEKFEKAKTLSERLTQTKEIEYRSGKIVAYDKAIKILEERD